MSPLDKDIELIQHSITLIEKDRLRGWHSSILSKNLLTSDVSRNVLSSLGVDYAGIDELESFLNILQTIRED
jgi:hypothetical protein